MIAKTKKAVCLSVIVLCLFSFSPLFSKSLSSNLKAYAQDPIVQELIPGFDYVKFFKDNNDFGYDPLTTANQNAATFGAYVIEPVGDKLYIGFSTGSPGNYDGALLAVYENGVLTPLGFCIDEACLTMKRGLTEQGVHDMTFVNGKLYIAGTDPCCNDDWTKGNVYTYTPGSNIIKHRTMENVLHTLGLWVDPSNNDIYAATGAHNGDNQTWVGRVYKSTDEANSWQPPADVSDYRVYDILGFQNKLYAAIGNVIGNELKVSLNNGLSWEKVNDLSNNSIYIKQRLTPFEDFFIGSNLNSDGLFSVDSSGNVSVFNFPGFIGAKNWSAFANENDNYIYLAADDGMVARSSDLVNWYKIVQLNQNPISLTYWSAKNMLIITDSGPQAQIKLIDLSQNISPSPIVPPTPTPVYFYASFGPKGIPDISWNTAAKILDYLNNAGYDAPEIVNYKNDIFNSYYYQLPVYENFDIKAGEGYLIRLNDQIPQNFDSKFTYTDVNSLTYNLSSGYTFISFPQKVIEGNPILQDAVSAVSDMNKNEVNATRMLKWNENTQTFVIFEPANPFSQNFTLESGKGYLVLSNKPFTWEVNNSTAITPSPTPVCAHFEESCANMDCCSPFTCDPSFPDPICRLLSVTLTSTSTPISCPKGNLGNLDCGSDGCIDTGDFELFRPVFGQSVSALSIPPAHHTPDLVVDSANLIDTADYEIFRNNFGRCN